MFRVSVPLASAASATQAKPAEQAGQPLAGLQVLCVDNEDSILIGMNSLLSRWGCQVSTARNREECAALLEQGLRPHLALVDYHLDNGEMGTELMAWLRTRLGEPVPGVVISADGHSETVARVHAAGLDYLSKPVKPAALRALLNRHLSLVQ
ncbi:response regulator [Pseudomonas brassicae]